MRLARAAAVALVATLQQAAPGRAAEPPSPERPYRLKATLGYHYSTGKYGTGERTEISYIPLTLRGELRNWTLSLTVPYIRIDGSSQTVIEGNNGPVLSTKADGLGDLIGSLSYLIEPPRTWLPFVELRTRIKFPTADKDDGLGTGEFDYTLEAELSQVVGPVTPYLGVGYRFLGDPTIPDAEGNSTRFHLDNVWLATAGTVYSVRRDLDLGLFLFFREASTSSTDAQLEILPYVDWELTPYWSTSTYVSAGILDGSPAFGVGLQVTFRY